MASIFEYIKNPIGALNRAAGLTTQDRRVMGPRTGPNQGGYGRTADDPDTLHNPANHHNRLGMVSGHDLFTQSRAHMYDQYRVMDVDPVLSMVLDAYADAACQEDSDEGKTVWVRAESQDVVTAVERILAQINIEGIAYQTIRSIARDGDVYMHMHCNSDNSSVTWRPYRPHYIARLQNNNGRLTGFSRATETGDSVDVENTALPYYSVYHFRMPPKNMEDMYGYASSFYAGIKEDWMQLQMMEDQVFLQRMRRRPDRTYWLMDTTGMSLTEAYKTVKSWSSMIYNEAFADPINQQFLSMGKAVGTAQDIFIPNLNGNNTDFKNVAGSNMEDNLKDVEMRYDRIGAGFGCPPGYFGRGNNVGYQPGQSLARQHSPFARRTARLQKVFLLELTRAVSNALISQGINTVEPKNHFQLYMSAVSPIDELERNEIIQARTDRLERAIALGAQYSFQNNIWVPYCLMRYGGFTAEQVVRFYPGAQIPSNKQPVLESKDMVQATEQMDKELHAQYGNLPELSLSDHTRVSVTDVANICESLPKNAVFEDYRPSLNPSEDGRIKESLEIARRRHKLINAVRGNAA